MTSGQHAQQPSIQVGDLGGADRMRHRVLMPLDGMPHRDEHIARLARARARWG